MPNRILRDYTLSEKVNELSAQAETLFIRLIMKADDFGSYHGNHKIIKSQCYPLKNDVRETDISRWIAECEKAGLLAQYNANNKPYIRIIDFGQRLRNMKNKFPDPEGNDLATTSSNPPPETELNQKQNIEEKEEKTPHIMFNLKAGSSEMYYQEFANSEAFNLVCMQGNIDKAFALQKLPEFKKHMGLSYKNALDFATHFKNWMTKKGYTKDTSGGLSADKVGVGTFGKRHTRK